ncbi:hypothetical protein OAA99_00260 [Omnitrophica bacterium]|nr:hypothetical protein [Candidatus Omnitrophota bacterium]
MEKRRSYRIGDTVIVLDWSRSKVIPRLEDNRLIDGFVCHEDNKPDILVYLEYGGIPSVNKRSVFESGSDCRFSKSGSKYIYERLDKWCKDGVMNLAVLNKDFKQATMFVQSRRKREKRKFGEDRWYIADVMTSFAQFLLLNYLAHNRVGMLVHSSVLRCGSETLSFFGKQNAGKSTMAGLWSRHIRGIEIFNDDKCIIKRRNRRFKIYSTPWAGSFTDYKLVHKEAGLGNAFFLYHSGVNRIKRLSATAAFARIMRNIFPPFWSEKGMRFITSLCHRFAREVDCYDLGFLNNKEIVFFLKERLYNI